MIRTAIVFLIGIIAIFVSGCTKHHYIPVESVRTEYRNIQRVDSIYHRDSITQFVKGDTIFKESFTLVYKDRILRDSIMRIDTIRVPYPVEIIKYKQGNKIAFSFIIIFIIFIIVNHIRKFL